MSIAVISDTHLGDASSRLVDNNGRFSPDLPAYQSLKNGILEFTGGKSLNHLVLCGDIMDFAIESVSKAITIARPFFAQIAADRLTESIVYVPGNHDKQVWDGLEWDTSVLGNLSDYRDPTPFKRVQPAHIDATGQLTLQGLSAKATNTVGEIFLRGLFRDSPGNPKIAIAYPNLYIERQGKSVIVTHGHLFETAWVLLSDLLHGVAGLPDELSLAQLEEWNVPLTSMSCTGVGSGGEVSQLFYEIEREAYEKRTDTLSATLGQVLPRLKDEFGMNCLLRTLFPNSLLQKAILSLVSKKAEDPRAPGDYLADSMRLKHFTGFLRATNAELRNLSLPASDALIFGHTHQPISSNNPYRPQLFPNMTLFNTGGWLKESEAAVFIIDGGQIVSFSG
jgi:predicted phosphodiesterase